ncbi:hypothetical protein A1Q2_01855 [Trichosporon asahii var. asahii CBS 8904]|uniref:Uncharacterized protein n=2 Tax=Trichosporon asahii var. asahii TaxID=189963 RepID=K1VWK4_TRIAC|nr:hypothetical protein A1Q1_04378 [Trichosporon asahii var. asahii CBS 2479]EJT46908.1 hypothetical protein A1Q1_04378 [Trichosporon asahii var. asahii CBS 2479]EKD03842.1 hypothetical protein A1Q2_01855 [Trichosporon asahii var. asahii CBS 8904]
MPSSFILAPAPAAPPAASSTEEVHLLPFSLGYSGPAPVSAFFRPRPAPSTHPYPGSTIASFRGRALVAQELELPRGYRGVILQAEATKYSGAAGSSSATAAAASESEESGRGRGAPLTPAPSATSVEDEGRVTRSTRSTSTSTRARGAGQVALSRPRTRATRSRNKRIALSDDEDEDEGEDVVKPMPKKARADPVAVPAINVPEPEPEPEVKKETAEGEEEGELEKEPRDRLKTPDVPAIVVLQATPGASQNENASQAPHAPPSPRPTEDSEPYTAPESTLDTDSTYVKTDSEDVKTASEDVRAETTETAKTPRPSIILGEDEEPSDVRVLYPSASFKSITLWTPDAPMPGFVADELTSPAVATKEGEESGLGQLRRSWWRQGGAGEGGDEFVRGLGEWIGLGEIVSLMRARRN